MLGKALLTIESFGNYLESCFRWFSYFKTLPNCNLHNHCYEHLTYSKKNWTQEQDDPTKCTLRNHCLAKSSLQKCWHDSLRWTNHYLKVNCSNYLSCRSPYRFCNNQRCCQRRISFYIAIGSSCADPNFDGMVAGYVLDYKFQPSLQSHWK